MAVSGSGGWKSSIGVIVRHGRLITVGLPQNKPREVVSMDLYAAADKVLTDPNQIVQVYFYQDFIGRLRELVEWALDADEAL